MTQRIRVALGVALLVVAASCQSGDTSDGTAPSSEWGPLAVAEFTGGDQALITGTIQITASCALLDERGESVLLVWPQSQTTWDSQDSAVVFVSPSGERVAFESGDSVTFVGSGSSTDEGGLTVDAFLASVSWTSEPNRDCVADTRWFVGDLVADNDT